jgi:hypothetical protein
MNLLPPNSARADEDGVRPDGGVGPVNKAAVG